MSHTKNQHCLVNKTISKLQIASDKLAIKFILDTGEEIVAKTDGDCCSNTWIEHVILPFQKLPAKVSEVINLDMPDLGNPDEHTVIGYYGTEIKTDKGSIVIDYRNASNGYYGGSLCWPEDYFYGGVFGQNISKEDWQELTEDI